MKRFLTVRNLIVALITGVLIGEMAFISPSSATTIPTPTVRKPATSHPAPCVVGGAGPGGGIVFYVSSTKINVQPKISGGGRCLEAAPKTWAGTGSDLILRWGCFGGKVGTSSAIGTGAKNTAKIMAGCATITIAARKVANLTFGGKSDWFLPSQDELSLMYTLFNSDGASNFAAVSYWSSSARNKYDAWFQGFGSEEFDVNYFNKNLTSYVRPIRAFG